MDALVLAQAPKRFSMDCIADRLSAFIKSADFAIEFDQQDDSLLVRQCTATGSAKSGLMELFTGLRELSLPPERLFVEFIPYNGSIQIVMGDEGEIQLIPRDSAMGRALWKAAFQKVTREIDEDAFTPPPADVICMPQKH